MPSSVLESPIAMEMNFALMRTFDRVRRLIATSGELVEQLTKLAKTIRFHDHQFKAAANVLERMIEHPAPPKRRIDFHLDGQVS